MVEVCEYCEEERELVDALAVVHLPELSNVVKEQPMTAEKGKRLCRACASRHETERLMPQLGCKFPVHDVVRYVDAARHSFFTYWRDGLYLTDDEVLLGLGLFFDGMRVTITPVDYGKYSAHGFTIVLEDPPSVRVVFCGEDPDTVPFKKQVIMVQTRDNFYASTMGGGPLAEALAVGLNVFMREVAVRKTSMLAWARERSAEMTAERNKKC